jgi:hypothetical protein
MIRSFAEIKVCAIPLILFFLACSGPARKSVSPDRYDLSVKRAKNIDWTKYKIKLVKNDGTESKGHLDGWTESGFIISNDGVTDTLAFDNLRNYVLIHRDKNYSNKGARYGLYAGIGAAAIAAYLIAGSGDNDNSAPGPEPLPPDAPIEEPGWRYVVAIASVPIIILTSAGIGAIIGSTRDKYERYYYDKVEFATSPYIYLKEPEPLYIEDKFQ